MYVNGLKQMFVEMVNIHAFKNINIQLSLIELLQLLGTSSFRLLILVSLSRLVCCRNKS